jgi:hypothetical protein
MGWEWRDGAIEISAKGPFARGAGNLVIPGGRTVTMPPTVAYSQDGGGRSWDFWFEDLGHRAIDINATMPWLNVFRFDALIHPAPTEDGSYRLKLYVTHWRGDGDAMRDFYVIRLPAFWRD